MQLDEIYQLTKWVDEFISDSDIIRFYSLLHEALQRNVQPNQPKQPFEEQKENLLAELRKIPLEKLSSNQLKVLENIGVLQYLGSLGAGYIEDVLFKNAIDVSTAAQSVNKANVKLRESVQWASQLKSLLDEFITPSELTVPRGKVLLNVKFAGDAGINNISELRDWSKCWYEIGRGLAMAHNQAPEDVRIVGASKGSIIFDLLTTAAIAKTAISVIEKALECATKYYQIKQKIQEIRQLKIGNDAAEKALESDADALLKSSADDAFERVASEIKYCGDGDGEVALKSSVRKLVDFIIKGGEVDFVDSDDLHDSDMDVGVDGENYLHHNTLRPLFEEVRRLEREFKRLGKDDDAPRPN